MKFLITVCTPYFVYTQYCDTYFEAMKNFKILLQQKKSLKSKFDITVKRCSHLVSLSTKQAA
jgi:hypothetical protein